MKSVTAKAPINIALVKYWGKKDPIKVLPYNPSISLTLEALCTITTLKEGTSLGVRFFINDVLQSEEEHKKVIDFLRQFDGFTSQTSLIIDSKNHVPTAAGFASSASGFAALAVAANTYFNTNYDLETLVHITRQGSGSAVRSLLGGAVLWQTDGTIRTIEADLTDYVMIFVLINPHQKGHSSREAMAHCVDTAYLYEYFVNQSHQDAKDMIEALKHNQFEIIGKIMESNSLLMHATTLTAQPPFTFLEAQSYKVFACIDQLRKKGTLVFATMDAGPNVKLLLKKPALNTIIQALNQEGFMDIMVSDIAIEGARVIHEEDADF